MWYITAESKVSTCILFELDIVWKAYNKKLAISRIKMKRVKVVSNEGICDKDMVRTSIQIRPTPIMVNAVLCVGFSRCFVILSESIKNARKTGVIVTVNRMSALLKVKFHIVQWYLGQLISLCVLVNVIQPCTYLPPHQQRPLNVSQPPTHTCK